MPEHWHPTVTILVPAYNEEATIADTVASIKSQTYPVAEIIVVDDCSSDKTGDIARALGVRVIRTPKNTGTKSQAQNFGLLQVNTDLVCTIDADTILAPDAIEKILPALHEGFDLSQKTESFPPEVAKKIVFSACGFVIPQRIKTKFEFARLGQYLFYMGWGKTIQDHWDAPLVSSGCFSMFNAKLLRHYGGFPAGSMVEDMETTWGALMNGFKIRMVPDALCYPKDPPTWPIFQNQVLRWNRGFLQLIPKYGFRILENKRMAFFIVWSLFVYIVAPLSLLATFVFFLWYYTVQGGDIQYGTIAMLPIIMMVGTGFDLATSFLVIAYQGYRKKCFKNALISFPFYWGAVPLENYLFVKAFFKEFILHERLSVWEKGH